MKKRSKKEIKRNKVLSILVNTTTVIVIILIWIFLYFYYINSNLYKSINYKKTTLNNIENNINNLKKEKDKLILEYDLLKSTNKDKVEELEVWENIIKKLK